MKNLLFFTLLLFTLHTSAQEAYNKGDVFIDICTSIGNAGVGYGGEIHYAFAPLFSVGAQFNSQSFNFNDKYITSFLPKLSADFHFGNRATIDWYAGLSGGYFIWQSNDPYENAGNTGCVITPPTYDINLRNNHKNNFIAWGAHLGFRYFIFKNVGLNGQASLGNVRWFKVGVSIKI